MSKWVVDAKDITKVYQMGEVEVHALRGLTMKIAPGEVLAIMGPSGSGKSTLMNILGCLDRPTSGDYSLNGESVADLTDDQLADIRNRGVGFVFQSFNLLPRATALTNVELPMRYSKLNGRDRKKVSREALEAVGLGDRMHHRPNELSGGQMQRVAIARALVNNPSIIMADEPTGTLDKKNTEKVLDIFYDIAEKSGVSVIMITHNEDVSKRFRNIIHLDHGKIVSKNF